jgi:pimeloyl-ACP methyl ester carboxylesterase
MKSWDEGNLSGLYDKVLAKYPIQTAAPGGHQWSWMDTNSGERTLLLLPGFMGEAESSFLYIQSIAPHFRVISVSCPPAIGNVDVLCDSLCSLLDILDIRQATILGGSTGGFLAQAFVRRHPARTGGLILTHTGLPNPRRARTARIYLNLLKILPFGLLHWLMQMSVHAYFPQRTAQQAFWRDHFKHIIQRQDKQSLQNRFALMEDFHSNARFQPAELDGWPHKILLMEMRRDHLTTPDEQAAMRELYPSANVHVFSDSAHYDSVEQPWEQIGVIIRFLSEQSIKIPLSA